MFFLKKCAIWSHVCRKNLILGALESLNPGVPNGGSKFLNQPFGAAFIVSELSDW